jgi:hypothetical protein
MFLDSDGRNVKQSGWKHLTFFGLYRFPHVIRCICRETPTMKYLCALFVCEHCAKSQNSDSFKWPQRRQVTHANPLSLTSFSRQEAHLSTCKFWSWVCYFFSKEVTQPKKSGTFSSILFSISGLSNMVDNTFCFLGRRMLQMHGCLCSRVK